jgi:hypothetical protein
MQRVYNDKLRADAIREYGGRCTCCGETNPVFLTIDHVNNDGAAHRKALGGSRGGLGTYMWLRRNGYPKEGFQLLCRNCNWAKFAEGSCPHSLRPSSPSLSTTVTVPNGTGDWWISKPWFVTNT